jgi:uncharacterized protein YqeY
MALKERIEDDIKAALLGRHRFRVDVLRGLKATILNEEVASGKREEGLDDSVIEQLVAREVKKRNESIATYTDAGRPELADSEQQEVDILMEYLPKQLSEEEIRTVVERIADDIGKDSKNMGQIIGATKQELGSSADGSVIAKIVKEITQNT